MAQKKRASTGPKGKKAAGKKARAKPAGPVTPWAELTLALLLAVLALRLGVNALELMPAHSGEAEYWAYGRELDWG